MLAGEPYVPLRPIAMKDRVGIIFLEHGELDVVDRAFVLADKTGVRVQIPFAGLACIMLEPGTRVSHAAVNPAARADRLLYWACVALDDDARLNLVREMYRPRFDEEAPSRRFIDQLRGIEGVRVREMCKLIARKYGNVWKARNDDRAVWDAADIPNRCPSSAMRACMV